MCLASDVGAASLVQKVRMHGDNAHMSPFWRKALPGSAQTGFEQRIEMIQRRTSSHAQLRFRHTDYASTACNTHTFSHEPRPRGCGKEGNQAPIDQIKALVCKVQWPRHIHHPKVRILQALHFRLHLGIGDHLLADVDPLHLDLGVQKRDLLHPASWSTANIEDMLEARQVVDRSERKPPIPLVYNRS